MKVQVGVRVKAKCVVKMLSVDKVWEGEIKMGRLGLPCSSGREARQSSAFYQAEWARLRAEWRERETPDFLSCCWNVQALGGRERVERSGKQKKSKKILVKHLCRLWEGTCPISPGSYRMMGRWGELIKNNQNKSKKKCCFLLRKG